MNHPIPYILLAESDANIVAYILLIAGPLLAMVFFYFWQKTKRTRDLMTATETSPKGQLTEGRKGFVFYSEAPLTSPWRQQPYVHYCFHDEEQRSRTDNKGNTTRYWRT